MPRDTENGQPAKRLRTGCQHRTGCTGHGCTANRGAAPHRPRLPVAAPAMLGTASIEAHRPTGHGHWSPASKAAARPRLASNRTRTANRGAAHRNRPRLPVAAPAAPRTGHRPRLASNRTRTEGLHRPTGHGHWLPASRTRRLERSLRSVWASGATGYRKRPTGQAAAHRLPVAAPAIGHGWRPIEREPRGCAPATAAPAAPSSINAAQYRTVAANATKVHGNRGAAHWQPASNVFAIARWRKGGQGCREGLR